MTACARVKTVRRHRFRRQSSLMSLRSMRRKGEAVLGLIFSSALSGTYASACVARDMVLEEIPDARIELIDTLAASAGEGLIVYDALVNRKAG